jgi:hypothetical protein
LSPPETSAASRRPSSSPLRALKNRLAGRLMGHHAPAHTWMALYLAAQETPDVSLLDRLSITLLCLTGSQPVATRFTRRPVVQRYQCGATSTISQIRQLSRGAGALILSSAGLTRGLSGYEDVTALERVGTA